MPIKTSHKTSTTTREDTLPPLEEQPKVKLDKDADIKVRMLNTYWVHPDDGIEVEMPAGSAPDLGKRILAGMEILVTKAVAKRLVEKRVAEVIFE